MYEFSDWPGLPGSRRLVARGAVTILEYERGLLYRKGAYVGELGPGVHRIRPFSGVRIAVLDLRRRIATVANQKLLTADQITITVTLTADYRVQDAAAAAHQVADFEAQLYADLQRAARTTLGSATMDELLADRGAACEAIREQVQPLAAAYGLELPTVGLKDIILAPRIRDLLLKEAEAKRLAQAALLSAREEVATMRALANAARLAEQHPHLMRLRELEAVRTAARAGSTMVFGVGQAPGIGAVAPAPPPPHAPAEAAEEAEEA